MAGADRRTQSVTVVEVASVGITRKLPMHIRKRETVIMRFFSFYPRGEGALSLVPIDLDYFQTHFIGRRMASDWSAPSVQLLSKSRPVRDFVSWFLGVMVVSERARASLAGLIGPHVEFLPLVTVKGRELFAANVVEVVHCLDHTASGVTYSQDDPSHVIHVRRFVFDKTRIRNVPVFKVPEWPAIFVSEEFVRIVVDERLAGAGFDNPEDIRYVKEPWDGTVSGLPKVRDFKI